MKTQKENKAFPAADSREITQLLKEKSMRYVSRSIRSGRAKNKASVRIDARVNNRFFLTCTATEASLLELKTYP